MTLFHKNSKDEGVKTQPKDLFLHLLGTVSLYVSAGSFLTLLFQYVNVKFPDPLEGYYAIEAALHSIRWSIAILLIVFPVCVWNAWFLHKSFREDPSRRNVRIRKWLLHLTVFTAALIIIGDLVSLLYNFLEGELTTRFLLKTIAVFLVAGIIFFYSFKEIRNALYEKKMKAFVFGSIVIIAIAVIVGFFVAGSPASQRVRKFDERRVGDLQFLQSEIVNYWQNKRKLPETLFFLRDDIRGIRVPKDPETNGDYEYTIKGSESFSLCATFSLPSSFYSRASKSTPPEPYYGGESWEHGTGIVCFDRTIDKDLYPPRPLTKEML